MTNLDHRTARLIAVGAAVAANCLTCLKTAAAKARQDEIKDKDIAKAIEIGKMVRHCAGSMMDEFAASISGVTGVRSFPAIGIGGCQGDQHGR